jgi:hypothetical protein
MKNTAFLAILVFSAVFLVSINLSSSSSFSTKTIEGNIKFIELPVSDFPYEIPIKFQPTEGVSKILNMEIELQGDFQFVSSATTSVYVKVNGFDCDPRVWSVPAFNVAGYKMYFDCTNTMSPTTDMNIILVISSNEIKQNIVRNVKGKYRITYIDNTDLPSEVAREVSKPALSFFGTEYNVGENGTMFLQLLETNLNPINNGYCQITAYYPDKTYYLNSVPMTFLDRGIYYRDFKAPSITGVYILNAYCFYSDVEYYFDLPYNLSYDGSKLFDSTDQPVNVQNTDCTLFATEGGRYQEYIFNQSEIGNINLSAITALDLLWVGQNDKTNNYLQIWNFTSSSWVSVGSSFDQAPTLSKCEDSRGFTKTLAYGFNNVVSGNVVKFRFYGGQTEKIYTDQANIIFHNNGSIVSDIRGSGELHISDRFSNLTGAVFNITQNIQYNQSTLIENMWNFTNRTLDEFKLIFVSGTEYISGERGISSAQFLKGGDPVIDGSCSVSIFYPNDTIFVRYQNTNYLTNSNGIYRYNFTVPNTEGVYDVDFNCSRGGNVVYIAGSFHVASWANSIIQINTTIVNLSAIMNKLNEIQVNISSINSSIYNIVSSTNQSIMNKLYMMQGELAGIYNISLQINQTVSNFSVNLTPVLDLISEVNISINNRLNDINSSIFTKLYAIQGDLSDIVSRLINLTSLVEGTNSSIMNKLYGIQSEITGLGNQIDAVNNTVMMKLYLMQDEIASVNNTVIQSNQSIMNKLYLIQDDLENLLNNLTNQLANVSNLTFNITTDLKTVATDVWELFFIRGTPPLAPSTDYYCKIDDPNTLVKNITYDYRGQAFGGYFTKTEDIHCSYGCINGTIFSTQAYCDYDPTTKIGVAIAIIVALIVITWFVLRSKEEGGGDYE